MYLRFRLELLINLSMITFKNPYLLFIPLFWACNTSTETTAKEIIERAVAVYGFHSSAHQIDFKFRDYYYSLEREADYYSYSRQRTFNQKTYLDVMTSNDRLKRYVNDSLIVLQDSLQKAYSNSLNSVMYFFQLPKPLQDPAVNPKLLNPITIEGKQYWTLQITFDQEGGGEDYQDEFRYWINKETFQIDYLAYNYLTDGGGTRFRKAQNKRNIEGFWFQDYLNFKPLLPFPALDSLPIYFEQGKLQKVSQIENKNITVSFP